MKKSLYIFIGLFVLGGGLFFALDFSYHAPAQKSDAMVRVEILDGDTAWTIAEKLKNKQLIGSKVAFLFGVWRDGLRGTFRSGVYNISRALSPADIAAMISSGKAQLRDIKVTFPEGWTAQEMADRLTEKGLDGGAFLEVVRHPTQELRSRFDFLTNIPKDATLEGFLFPETYFFLPETTPEEMVAKMLVTFDTKTQALRAEGKSGKSFFEILTMASILEGEVKTDADRKLVSGIFWKRIESGMRLQSDATLDYILQSGKIQHSGRDLETDSLYNTYKYEGLPPGPVCNPSLSALEAALHPTDSSYLYFLSDPQTGKTYFAKDFEEHKANKAKVGL